MLLCLTQFGDHGVQVPVNSKEDKGANSHERPGVSNECSRKNHHNDEQHDDEKVNQCLIDLLVIHCGVSLSCCYWYLCYSITLKLSMRCNNYIQQKTDRQQYAFLEEIIFKKSILLMLKGNYLKFSTSISLIVFLFSLRNATVSSTECVMSRNTGASPSSQS